MLPLALGYVIVLASTMLGMQAAGIQQGSWAFTGILLGLNVVLLVLLFGLLDRGRIISPAYSRLDKRNLAKLREITAERERAHAGGSV
jgi:hypothetical protein